jgi:DNA helicase IV
LTTFGQNYLQAPPDDDVTETATQSGQEPQPSAGGNQPGGNQPDSTGHEGESADGHETTAGGSQPVNTGQDGEPTDSKSTDGHEAAGRQNRNDYRATSSPAVIAAEIAEEQAHVDRVYARLDAAAQSARNVAAEGQALYRSSRESYIREEDSTGLLERDVFAYQAAKRLAVLDAEHEGLVFGRLDRANGEIHYIGRLGVRDADYEPLVIDWRAPAAEPFYRATPTRTMDVVRRRVLRSRGETVIGIEDDLLDPDHAGNGLVVVGEGALMSALTRARGPKMADIVATIQAEQDEAIRAPHRGVTMITGGPGTGKTVVALHRTAYLLYTHRRRFESGGVLVVGPSRLFMDYIERVLPSLGEESVTLRPIGSVPADVLADTSDRVDPPELGLIKGRQQMAGILKRLVSQPPPGAPDMLALTIDGEPLAVRTGELSRIRAAALGRHRLNQGRSAAEAALLDALWHAAPESLDLDRDQFDRKVQARPEFPVFCDAWWPYRSANEMLTLLADRQTLHRVAGGALDESEQQLLADNLGQTLAAGAEPTVADAALLDELVDRLGTMPQTETEPDIFLDENAVDSAGQPVSEVVTTADQLSRVHEADPEAEPYTDYAHILVDEAQDISPMQWRMLRRRGQHASWTIVGDLAQSSWPDADEADRARQQAIGNAPQREFRMSTNYRSPAEVFELAAKIGLQAYPAADLPTPVRATGFSPQLRVAESGQLSTDAIQATRDLLDAVEGTVGVLCPEALLPRLRAAIEHALDESDLARTSVLTAVAAKGLEYDGVLVVDPDEISATSPGNDRVLYVALTRPTQRLITLDRSANATWRKPLE